MTRGKEKTPRRQARGVAEKGSSIVARDGFWQLAIVGVFVFAAFILPHILYPIAAAQNGWC